MSALETEALAHGYGGWTRQHEPITLREQKRLPSEGRRFSVSQLLGHLKLS